MEISTLATLFLIIFLQLLSSHLIQNEVDDKQNVEDSSYLYHHHMLMMSSKSLYACGCQLNVFYEYRVLEMLRVTLFTLM